MNGVQVEIQTLTGKYTGSLIFQRGNIVCFVNDILSDGIEGAMSYAKTHDDGSVSVLTLI